MYFSSYFFFAAFFAGFFAAFLAAFFVAIVSILPLNCNSNVAVNECIEARKKSVKKKIAFGAIFFRASARASTPRVSCFGSEKVRVLRNGDKNSGEGVVPCVRDHAGAQAATLHREQAEHDSVGGDDDHAAESLVSVRGAKQQ